MLMLWEIEEMYDDYLEECKEKGIEPEFKDATDWWTGVE